MAFMLPNNDARNLSLESKLERMRHASYRRMAAHAVDLDEILSSLKENLQKEQRRVMELNFLTLHKILSPIQVCCLHLIIQALFPQAFPWIPELNSMRSRRIVAAHTDTTKIATEACPLRNFSVVPNLCSNP